MERLLTADELGQMLDLPGYRLFGRNGAPVPLSSE